MMTTYHGNLDLEKERVAADRASDAGDRRMSNRSNPRLDSFSEYWSVNSDP